jgi:hypothetical protein
MSLSILSSRLCFSHTVALQYRPADVYEISGLEERNWKHLLASITGTVDQGLLVRNTYLVAENRILRN